MKNSFAIFFLISFSMNSQILDVINPKKNIGIKNWNIVNDDVMGGISTSTMSLNKEKNLLFKGNLSLENNGGFASSRLSLEKNILNGVKFFKIKFKGDGNTYKLRFRQNNRRASYSHDFKSSKDEWIEVDLRVEDFKATWRGYSYSDYPALEPKEVISMGLQISDKQEGDFILEIEYIKSVF